MKSSTNCFPGFHEHDVLCSADFRGGNPNEIAEGRPEGSPEVRTDGRSDPRAVFDNDLNLIPVEAAVGLLDK